MATLPGSRTQPLSRRPDSVPDKSSVEDVNSLRFIGSSNKSLSYKPSLDRHWLCRARFKYWLADSGATLPLMYQPRSLARDYAVNTNPSTGNIPRVPVHCPYGLCFYRL